MAYSKIKKILFILLCCFILIFPFWCVRGLCAEVEDVEVSTVNGIAINSNSNVFIESSSARSVGYVLCDPDYIYYIYCPSDFTSSRNVATSSDVPTLNGTYNYLGEIAPGDTYTFRPTQNQYIYLDWSIHNGSIVVTRSKVESMNGAVDDLVNNVGIASIWNIFDISINYIVIVVLVAFGLFIIFRIIRKVSKGKEGL